MINTLITNNCWGGIIYNNYKMEFRSPTINLQILPDTLMRALKNLYVVYVKHITSLLSRLSLYILF